MTFEDLFKYPPAHFEHHLGQLSAGSVSRCSSDSDPHYIKGESVDMV
jgi:hypothetical protein